MAWFLSFPNNCFVKNLLLLDLRATQYDTRCRVKVTIVKGLLNLIIVNKFDVVMSKILNLDHVIENPSWIRKHVSPPSVGVWYQCMSCYNRVGSVMCYLCIYIIEHFVTTYRTPAIVLRSFKTNFSDKIVLTPQYWQQFMQLPCINTIECRSGVKMTKRMNLMQNIFAHDKVVDTVLTMIPIQR